MVWRGVLHNVSLPGALLAATLMLAVADPRQGLPWQRAGGAPSPAAALQRAWAWVAQAASKLLPPPPSPSQPGKDASGDGNGRAREAQAGRPDASHGGGGGMGAYALAPAYGGGGAAAAALALPLPDGAQQQQQQEAAVPPRPGLEVIKGLMTSTPFMTTTAAAALNDVASYAMIAWQVRRARAWSAEGSWGGGRSPPSCPLSEGAALGCVAEA